VDGGAAEKLVFTWGRVDKSVSAVVTDLRTKVCWGQIL
jgi:hypothetical protein